MATSPSNIPGQMTVDECIEIAETGADGVRTVPRKDRPPRPRPKKAARPSKAAVQRAVEERLRKERR